jgi:uncharacterized protein (DUF488 family)
MSATPTIWTIGHALCELAHWFALLEAQRIALIADVRSQPFSRRAPQFNKAALSRAASAHGLAYRFLGQALGGREAPEALRRTAEERAAAFAAAIDEVLQLAGDRRVVLLCAEEDPVRCHRHHVVGRALLERGAEVRHLRADGRVQSAAELCRAAPQQLDLLAITKP